MSVNNFYYALKIRTVFDVISSDLKAEDFCALARTCHVMNKFSKLEEIINHLKTQKDSLIKVVNKIPCYCLNFSIDCCPILPNETINEIKIAVNMLSKAEDIFKKVFQKVCGSRGQKLITSQEKPATKWFNNKFQMMQSIQNGEDELSYDVAATRCKYWTSSLAKSLAYVLEEELSNI
jgi:hypothetical protein